MPFDTSPTFQEHNDFHALLDWQKHLKWWWCVLLLLPFRTTPKPLFIRLLHINFFLTIKLAHFHQLSKPIKAEEAHELGLVDAVVSANDLLNIARRWALDIFESKRPWVRALYKSDKLGSPEEAREILNFARAQAREQAANLHHPLICINVIEEGIVSGPRAGLRKVCDLQHLPCYLAFGLTRKRIQI